MKSSFLPLRITILITFLFVTLSVKSQLHLTEEWVHTTGEPDTVDYSAAKVDGSGNIYVTTNTISATEKANILTTKYNSSGTVIWEVEKDNADDNDYGSAIEVDGSGNVYVAGATWVDGTNKYDYIVIKYNSSGTQQWAVTYNGPGNFYDIPTDIFVDGSGNVYVTGGSYGSGTLSDFCTIKYNSAGSAQWTSRYDYSNDQDVAAILREGPTGSIFVIGASENAPANWDFAAIKYHPSTGTQINENRNSASGSGFDQVFGCDVDASGNVYITGRAEVVDEGFNMRTIKLEDDLDLVWARNYDHDALDDESHGVVVDIDGSVYVSGWVTNANGSKSFETIKYNSSGTPQWHREEIAPNGLDAYGLKISHMANGNIVVAGNIDNGSSIDFLTAIYNQDGDRLWIEQYDSPAKDDDVVNFVKADVDGIYYVGGKTYGISATTNLLIKYNSVEHIIPPDDDMYHPSSFTYFENKGQIIDNTGAVVEDVKFYTNRHNPSLFFTDDNLSYVWARVDTVGEDDTLARIDVSFVGSNGGKIIQRAESQGGEYLNYFLAHCGDGITNVRSSDRLIVTDVYDDVDIEYYFDQFGLKYYIIVKPGWSAQADPISLLYEGADDINITGGGELEIIGPLGTITQHIADAYQIDAEGEIVPLGWDADYVEIDDFEIGFDLDTYDDGFPLVIEIRIDGGTGPAGGGAGENATWCTLYGFSGFDNLYDVSTNYKTHSPSFEQPDEVIYTAGVTYNSVFPDDWIVIDDMHDGFDYFIQKFWEENGDFDLPVGTPVWATFLGGSENEGNIFPEFPLAGGYSEDGTPSLAVQNLDGGSGAKEKIYLVGTTLSDDIEPIELPGLAYNQPTKPNASTTVYDGIVYRLDNTGTVDWATYVGGDNGHTTITGATIGKEGGSDYLYICGGTEGGELFPLLDPDGGGPGFSDDNGFAFASKFDNSGVLIWSTQFGNGSGDLSFERASDISVYEGTIVVTGRTSDDGFPTTVGADQEAFGGGLSDGFVIRFDDDYSIDWATYYGKESKDWARTVTHDLNGDIYIGGTSFGSASIDPWIDAALEGAGGDVWDTPQGLGDAFLARYTPSGDVLWSTYFGGDDNDYITDLNIDENRNVLFVTGYTASNGSPFPIDDDLPGVYALTGTLANISSSFIAAFDEDVELIYSSYIGYEVTAWGTAIYAAGDHYYAVGYESFEDDLNPDGGGAYEEFKPLQDFDEFSEDDYYQDLPNSVVEETGGALSFLNYEAYICMFDYAPFEEFGTEVGEVFVPDISVYPNPTSNTVIIHYNNHQIEAPILTNVYGQSCDYRMVANNGLTLTIDLSKLASGIYYLTFPNESNTTVKIVKL